MNQITSLFSDPNGNISSKRVMGIMLIINAIILTYFKSDPVSIGSLLGAGTALLGVSAVTKT